MPTQEQLLAYKAAWEALDDLAPELGIMTQMDDLAERYGLSPTPLAPLPVPSR